MNKKTVIGVTGGLATGKTTISEMLAGKGAVKIDADKVAHDLLREDTEIKHRVIEIFGDEILTSGEIDRRKLAEKVFSSKEGLDDLCSVIHPAIIRRIKDDVEKCSGAVVVIDAPLLIEVGLRDYVDIVVVVTADYDTQVKRATDRGISEKEAISIIDKQMPLSEKIKFADYIIDNNRDMDSAKKGVEEIWKKK